MADDDDEAPGSPWRALVGLIAIVAIGLGAWFVVQQLRHTASLQDCLASGRTNCAPISGR
jgi:hypothetical protein